MEIVMSKSSFLSELSSLWFFLLYCNHSSSYEPYFTSSIQ